MKPADALADADPVAYADSAAYADAKYAAASADDDADTDTADVARCQLKLEQNALHRFALKISISRTGALVTSAHRQHHQHERICSLSSISSSELAA